MNFQDEQEVKFREKVHQSWILMQQIVSQVTENCFILHSIPIEGGGYDCLALALGEPTSIRLLLNRRGSSALVNSRLSEDVWERMKSRGVENVAQEIIELGEFVINGSVTPTALRAREVAREVVDWIEEHKHENFYVGPLRWDGGPNELLGVPPVKVTENEWPDPWQGPEIALAIDMIETRRINQMINKMGAS